MSLRFLPLLALLPLAACTWEGRPDGAEAVHSASDGYYDDAAAPTVTPLGGGELVEPLDATTQLPPATDAPVPLDQPAPTTGSADNTTEVEEALTPGTEQ